jgi:hypothetical protein
MIVPFVRARARARVGVRAGAPLARVRRPVSLPASTGIDRTGPRAELDLSSTALVLVDVAAHDDGEHLRSVADAWDAGVDEVLVVVHDVHAAPGNRYAPISSTAGYEAAHVQVQATWGAALSVALPRVRGRRLAVLDAGTTTPPEAIDALLAALDEAVLAAPVVRTPDDLVASMGAALPVPGAPAASVLRGFPAADAEALGARQVFALDEPTFAVRTASAAIPVATVDTRTAVVRFSRDVLDAPETTGGAAPGGAVGGGARCVVVPLGRVYRHGELRERRYDQGAADALAELSGSSDTVTVQLLAAAGLRATGVAAEPSGLPVALREPVLHVERSSDRIAIRERDHRLRWALRIAAHPGPRGDDWGDLFFAEDLAAALRELGQDVVIDHRESHVRPHSEHLDDVSLVLRGLDDTPVNPAATNVLWVISHPDRVTDAELARFALRYAAGPVWARATQERSGLRVAPLLQATTPSRFHPDGDDASAGIVGAGVAADVVFVGKTRAVLRPVVRAVVDAGLAPAVWGEGWAGILDSRHLRGTFLPNAELPAVYRAARVVLNDHWDDMAAGGFLSNRLFDAVACGASVLSDPVDGMAEVFGDAVRTVGPDTSSEELRSIIGGMRRLDASVARRIGTQHSFAARARVLLDDVLRHRTR